MKILQKVLLILIIGVCVFMVMPQNEVRAGDEVKTKINSIVDDVKGTAPTGETKGIMGVINRIIGFIQWASIIALVLVLIAKGWQYITGPAEIKDEVKKTAIPILVGLILVFGATTIAKFVLNTTSNL